GILRKRSPRDFDGLSSRTGSKMSTCKSGRRSTSSKSSAGCECSRRTYETVIEYPKHAQLFEGRPPARRFLENTQVACHGRQMRSPQPWSQSKRGLFLCEARRRRRVRVGRQLFWLFRSQENL